MEGFETALDRSTQAALELAAVQVAPGMTLQVAVLELAQEQVHTQTLVALAQEYHQELQVAALEAVAMPERRRSSARNQAVEAAAEGQDRLEMLELAARLVPVLLQGSLERLAARIVAG